MNFSPVNSVTVDPRAMGVTFDLDFHNTEKRPLEELYPQSANFSPETIEFLTTLSEIDAQIQTIVFDEGGAFTVMSREEYNATEFKATIHVTVDTNEVKAELNEEREATEEETTKMSTATKVAILLASGIALAAIYKYSDQMLGISTESLKKQMEDVAISVKKPFETLSETLREKILGSEEKIVCGVKDPTQSCELKGSRIICGVKDPTQVCQAEKVKVTWLDALKDLFSQSKLQDTKLVKGIVNFFRSFSKDQASQEAFKPVCRPLKGPALITDESVTALSTINPQASFPPMTTAVGFPKFDQSELTRVKPLQIEDASFKPAQISYVPGTEVGFFKPQSCPAVTSTEVGFPKVVSSNLNGVNPLQIEDLSHMPPSLIHATDTCRA